MTMLFSDEVIVRKPSSQILHLAVQHLDVQPNAVVHISDSMSSDIAGAKSVGWRAIHFVTPQGRDQIAESNPQSLMNLSKSVDKTS
jgi:FMN phosphatase YigB (HAD superfamily)